MSALKNRVRKLEADATGTNLHYAWVFAEPGETIEQAVRRCERERGITIGYAMVWPPDMTARIRNQPYTYRPGDLRTYETYDIGGFRGNFKKCESLRGWFTPADITRANRESEELQGGQDAGQ